jgi:hypothetical protein
VMSLINKITYKKQDWAFCDIQNTVCRPRSNQKANETKSAVENAGAYRSDQSGHTGLGHLLP